MTGRDTKAHLTGFFIGLVAVAIVVYVTMVLTNKKFEGRRRHFDAALSP